MKTVYYKKDLVDSHEFSEIDFYFQDYIGFNYEKHDDYVEITDDRGEAEGYPIAINTLIHKLEEMRRQGATHVSLEYHMDHIGYLIDGWKVSRASEKEIEEFIQAQKTKKGKTIEMKKEELRRKLAELEKYDNI